MSTSQHPARRPRHDGAARAHEADRPGTNGGRRAGERRRMERRRTVRAARQQILTESIRLLKLPVLVLAIYIALLGARTQLGIDLGNLSAIGPGGVTFRERSDSLSSIVAVLQTQLKDVRYRVELLRGGGIQPVAGSTGVPADEQARFEQLQQIPIGEAGIASALGSTAPIAAGKEGYLWIGDVARDTRDWTKRKLRRPDGGEIPNGVSGVEVDEEYVVTGNMVLRDGLPANDAEYFLGRAPIGVVPRNARVVVVEAPKWLDRGYAVQCWVKVRVLR